MLDRPSKADINLNKLGEGELSHQMLLFTGVIVSHYFEPFAVSLHSFKAYFIVNALTILIPHLRY